MAAGAESESALEDGAFNPCFRLVRSASGITVASQRRGGAWQQTMVTRAVQPLLFALLTSLLEADDDVELELGVDERAALASVGLWLPRTALPAETHYEPPHVDAPEHPVVREAADCIVHPALSSTAPDDARVAGSLRARPATVWIAGVPVAVDELEAELTGCVPGAPPPPMPPAMRTRLRRAGLLPTRAELAARADALAATARDFARDGWALVELLPAATVASLARYYRRLVDDGAVRFGDEQVARRFAQHNEPIARTLHAALADTMSAAIGTKVKPSYCYFAAYRDGAELAVHRDRAQCKYSASLLVDYEPRSDGAAPWPLWLRRAPDEPGLPLCQRVGEAVLYLGCELYHWRDALPPGHRSAHIFFHFVDDDFTGPLD